MCSRLVIVYKWAGEESDMWLDTAFVVLCWRRNDGGGWRLVVSFPNETMTLYFFHYLSIYVINQILWSICMKPSHRRIFVMCRKMFIALFKLVRKTSTLCKKHSIYESESIVRRNNIWIVFFFIDLDRLMGWIKMRKRLEKDLKIMNNSYSKKNWVRNNFGTDTGFVKSWYRKWFRSSNKRISRS